MENLNNLSCSTCGGSLVIEGNLYKCSCCGNTYPKKADLTSEMVTTLNRADSLRRKFQFDDALEEYELVLEEDRSQVEANWGAFLCEYGIEYVLDYDESYKPTCHRISERPVSKSKYYAELSDEYKEKAAEIESIRQKVIKQVSLVPAYDVFLCYKQNSMEGSNITEEAKWARDVYEELTYKNGLKVFYAEKSLAELNVDWEPHIYSALRSSKLMIVFASKLDNLESPWVKNEWKRFHSFMEEDSSKMIRVVYEKIDPYQLPRELQGKQAIDQDRGNWMGLVVEAATSLNNGRVKDNSFYTKKYSNPMVARAMMCLEDGDFNRADVLADEVLRDDGLCAKAYIIKLMANFKVKYESLIYQIPITLSINPYFEKAMSCADDGYRKYLQNLADENLSFSTYQEAIGYMNRGDFANAASLLNNIRTYKNASNLIIECNNKLRGRVVNGLGVTRAFANNSTDSYIHDETGSNARQRADIFNTRSNNICSNATQRLAGLTSTYRVQMIIAIVALFFFVYFGWIIAIIFFSLASGTKKQIVNPVAVALKTSPDRIWNEYKGGGKNPPLYVQSISKRLYDLYGTDIDLNKMFIR